MMIRCIFLFYLTILSLKSIECSDSEKTLVRKLLRDYEPLARPVNDSQKPVLLTIIVTLKQIVDLDERNQILKTNIWLEYYWNDTNLTWDPEKNHGIKDIRIPPSKIWKPDVLLYNSASQEFDTTYAVNVNVNHEGLCKYGPPAIFESTCKIDIRMFPFDTQNCTLKFGSWTYHNKSIDLTIKTNHYDDWRNSNSSPSTAFEDWYMGHTGYKKSGEWQLEGIPALRENPMFEYDGKKEWYPSITYTIMIRRRTLYYWSNLILPCVIIASLTVLGFYYPPEAGEKVSLEITILMALTFFMQVVSDMQPPSSQIPIISTYFTSIMVMVACSVFCTILVLNYHHRLASNGAMPALIQKVFLQWLPWLLRMSRNGEKITKKSIDLQNKMEELKKMDNSSKSLMANILEKNDDYILPPTLQEIPSFNYASSLYRSTGFINELNFNNYSTDCPKQMYCDVKECNQNSIGGNIGSIHDLHPNPTTKQPDYFLPYMKHTAILKKELESIIQEIQFITDKYRDEAEEASLEDDWKYAAMVFDRFCLYSFTIFTGVLSAAVFLIPDRVIVY